jgi:hypothetical protein
MDTDVVITLLTITVILLSIVILAMLVAMTIVLVKVQRLVKNINAVMDNVASATEWLSPVKVISYVSKLFRK